MYCENQFEPAELADSDTYRRIICDCCFASTQVRFVPDNIDGPRFDPRTVGQSVPDSVTLPLLCEEQ